VVEHFRQWSPIESSPDAEQAAEPEPSGLFDHERYHVPRRFDPASEGTGLFPPHWTDVELDPQRLDGRSPEPTPPAGARPQPPTAEPPRGGLADFLMRRAAMQSEAPRARPRRAPEARPVRPKPAETPSLFPGLGARAQPAETPPLVRGPAARPKPAETIRPLIRAATRGRPAEAAAPATDVPAAEDPRVFLLHRMLSPAALERPETDVETRPRRSYPVRWPGTSRETRIRPEYHGVGVLQAATHAHGQLHTRGLGLMFPPHTVHARDSTSVVVGNNCELTQVDHVHIRQAVVAQDDALRSGRVKEIVARARPDRDNTDVVHDLRRALNDLVERPAEAGPTTMSRKLRADCVPSIHRAETVQLGDDAMTRLDSRYVVERTIVPAGALLADSEELASQYVAVVADASDDPGALAGFLGDLVGAAENATDDNVLGYADGLPEQQATVLGLFGMVTVNQATSVMIGVGNQLHTELDLNSARFRPDRDIKRGLRQHRANRPPEPDGEGQAG